jgi:ribonuclease III
MDFGINNPELLLQALTHSSYTKDHPEVSNNERLEFFGDAVLKLIFSNYLFYRFPYADEGLLTKYRARLISDDLLSRVSSELSINKVLRVGVSMYQNGAPKKLPKSVMGDALEALIGAIYIDSGYSAAEDFVLMNWSDHIEQALEDATTTDYKSILQEKIQLEFKKSPEYRTIDAFGPDHNKEFEIGVFLEERLLGKARGSSKKEAGQNAAKAALEELK